MYTRPADSTKWPSYKSCCSGAYSVMSAPGCLRGAACWPVILVYVSAPARVAIRTVAAIFAVAFITISSRRYDHYFDSVEYSIDRVVTSPGRMRTVSRRSPSFSCQACSTSSPAGTPDMRNEPAALVTAWKGCTSTRTNRYIHPCTSHFTTIIPAASTRRLTRMAFNGLAMLISIGP